MRTQFVNSRFSAVFSQQGFNGRSVFNIGKGQVSPTLGIRMSNVYTILPVSGVFILIYNVLNIIDSVAAIVNNKKGGAA